MAKMKQNYYIFLCALFVCSTAGQNSYKRKTNAPYIADAVGNTLAPPSNGPATVGSPSNLLTPDRYEFYTFDESGELVKRLMTLEEIQAIVAAGEGTDGHLVTFANDDQPTIAFNFSQPPFTKVHSVVTNVQNVLKAQMEAQKNNPPTHASLDTPDVSDSWSLILPSIFGNTGVDIVPDKSSSSFSTPETETIEIGNQNPYSVPDNNLSKEGNNELPISSTTSIPSIPSDKESTAFIKVTPLSHKTESTNSQIATSSTTNKPKSSTTTSTTTTTTTTTTTETPTTKTVEDSSTNEMKKITTLAPKVTTIRFKTTKKPQTTLDRLNTPTTLPPPINNKLNNITNAIQKINSIATTEKTVSQKYEKINTIATTSPNQSNKQNITKQVTTIRPLTFSTKRFVTPGTYVSTTSAYKSQPTITTYKPPTQKVTTVSSTIDDTENEKGNNVTILTTQSVSPSTTASTTEKLSADKEFFYNYTKISQSEPIKSSDKLDNVKDTSESLPIPVFDVAQSISQIASDLGNNIMPTSTAILEATNPAEIELESKENGELDIPNDSKNLTTLPQVTNDNSFIKVSTIDPIEETTIDKTNITSIKNQDSINDVEIITSTPGSIVVEKTTIDPILSESMDDLLSQVVNQGAQSIIQTTENDVQPIISTERNTMTMTLTKENDSKIVNINKENIKTGTKASAEIATTTLQNELSSQLLTTTSENITSVTTPSNVLIIDEEKESIKISNANNISSSKNNTILKEDISNKNKDSENKSTLSQDNKTPETNTNLSKIKTETIKASNVSVLKTELKEETNSIKNYTSNLQPIKIDTRIKESFTEEPKKKFQKVNIDDKELENNINYNNTWKLISTVTPPKANELPKEKIKSDQNNIGDGSDLQKELTTDSSKENQGLELTTKDLSEDLSQFTDLCNELSFKYWNTVIENIDKKRSFILSPFSITSMLAMMFMGARGATSGEMNEILKLDDMVTFNPHFTLKNISDSIETTPQEGVAVSAFVRELYSDRTKGKILTFYKERAQHFYNGHVEEVNFKLINDIIRRRTNLLLKRYSWGKIGEYMKSNSIAMTPPLAALSANVFQTDCSGSSVEGRDGEMYFVVSPNVRQRRLVPVPAVVYKKGFLAGYDPVLDATAAALGSTNTIISTIFLMPGQQGNVVHAEDLEALEQRLLSSNPAVPTWNRLLRTLLPRIGLELQIPRFSHKSTFNVSSTLKIMGLKDLFDPSHADLGGLNGPSKDLYVSDMVQTTTFVTCGEGIVADQHHIEEYPESTEFIRRRRTSRWTAGWDEPRDYQRAFHDPHDVGDAMHLPLHLRPRQARLPARNAQPARLKFDRPFLYFVRHNPTGMILYVGRYNPRLLP